MVLRELKYINIILFASHILILRSIYMSMSILKMSCSSLHFDVYLDVGVNLHLRSPTTWSLRYYLLDRIKTNILYEPIINIGNMNVSIFQYLKLSNLEVPIFVEVLHHYLRMNF